MSFFSYGVKRGFTCCIIRRGFDSSFFSRVGACVYWMKKEKIVWVNWKCSWFGAVCFI